MNIKFWTTAVLALFKPEFSFDSTFEKHFNLHDGFLTTCVYAEDKPFKEKSPTFPRSELREIEEYDHNINVTVDVIDHNVTSDFDYSLWQIFDKKPFLMIRKRLGQKQLVAFDGKPKIQEIKHWPKNCIITCGRKGKIDCEGYVAEGRFKCKELHLKLGIYSQQMNPKTTQCLSYGEVSINSNNTNTCTP